MSLPYQDLKSSPSGKTKASKHQRMVKPAQEDTCSYTSDLNDIDEKGEVLTNQAWQHNNTKSISKTRIKCFLILDFYFSGQENNVFKNQLILTRPLLEFLLTSISKNTITIVQSVY